MVKKLINQIVVCLSLFWLFTWGRLSTDYIYNWLRSFDQTKPYVVRYSMNESRYLAIKFTGNITKLDSMLLKINFMDIEQQLFIP